MNAEDRLRALDEIRPPDQWADIVERRPSPRLPDRGVTRLLTITLALAVAAGGIGLAAGAFLAGEPQPSVPTRPVPAPSPTPEASPVPFPPPQRYPTHADPWGDPRALHVTCEDGRVVVGSAEVPAQPDGVHVLVRNPDGSAEGLRALLTPKESWPPDYSDDYRVPLEPGLNRILLPLPPGPARVGCGGQRDAPELVEIRVRDPEGLWVPDQLPCEDTIGFVRPVDRGTHPGPETAMRTDVPGVLPGDEIVKTGYPRDRSWPGLWVMLVVRDGEPVAAIHVIYSEDEGWVVFTGGACADSGIRGRVEDGEAGPP